MTLTPADRNFRLPDGVRPRRYDAFLSVEPEARTFHGRIRIGLDLAGGRESLALHGAGLRVRRAVVRAGGAEQLAEVTSHPASETLVLRPPRPVPAGAVEVELEWEGDFSAGLRGLYRAGPLAATQFEAADARRVFPCLDEPGFKAPWAISLEVPAGAVALSNGAERSREARGGREVVAFAETPPLPTYLVALVVGPAVPCAPGDARGVPVRTWAVAAKAHLSGFGQDVALAVLPRLEDYFGLPYAFGKLDQVGLPDFEFGAMENAGLVTYRETALLLDPSTASLAVKKRVAEIITHELAHQWFGNWVTMRWWDDLWLNESFATWMAYKIVAGWRPEWRIWLDFDQGKASALALDALRSTHPIHAEVHNPEDMGEAFDLITYEKGGAVLRMIEAWLGEERFREGIRLYMRRHARSNAVARDLWAALQEASGEPVVETADAWIRTPGFPLVSLSREGSRVRLAQRRFLSEPGAAEGGTWPVPVVVRWADDRGAHETRLRLEGAAGEVTLPVDGKLRWAFGNAGSTGFYRVDHDAAGRAALAAHLRELAPAERVALLSDEWALLRAGAREPEPFLDLLAAYGGESDRAVLEEMVLRLGAVEHRLPDEASRRAFRAFVAGLLRPAFEGVGLEAGAGEDDEARLRRSAVVRGMALVARDPAVSEGLRTRLARFLGGDREALEANLQDAAVGVAARDGGPARFEEMLRLYREEKDPAFQRRYLMGLTAFEDPSAVRRAVEMPFAGDVPLQDLASFAGGLLANRSAADGFWALLRERWEPLQARLADAPLMTRRLVEGLGSLTTRRQLDEVRAFFSGRDVPAARQGIAQTTERLALDVSLWERIAPAVAAWLATRTGTAR